MATKINKNSRAQWIARIVVAIVLIAGLCISLLWAEPINRKFGLTKVYDGASRDEVLAPSDGALGDDLNVHFIDVGQGDSCVIELPDEKKMIIDGGKDSEKQKALDYIDSTIRDGQGEKITRFDYAILTHPDEDHCGGLDDILEEYPAEVFYRPNVLCTYAEDGFSDPAAAQIRAQQKHSEHQSRAYARTLTAGYNTDKTNGVVTEVRITDASDEAVSLITPDGLSEDDPDYYTITFYAPVLKHFTDVNDYSPIIILEYHKQRIALSGDAEKAAETDFVSRVQAAKTDGKTDKYDVFTDTYSVSVLKLGHHGSKTSSSQDYLETLTAPETTADVVCIISCGVDNSYGHPSPETLARLKEMGFTDKNILSTANNKSIALSIRAEADPAGAEAPVYRLYYGADVLHFEQPTLQAGAVKLQWQEIVYALIVLIVLALIVMPLITAARKKYRKAVRAATRTAQGGRARKK